MIDGAIAAWRQDGIPYGTHYENCAEHHARCAIFLLANEIEKLRAAGDALFQACRELQDIEAALDAWESARTKGKQ